MPINHNHISTMQITTPEKIFVVYDNREVNTVCATTTMNDAITKTIRYMYGVDYIVKEFTYDEAYTVIDYVNVIRIGPEIHEEEGTITIMETRFYRPE